MSKYNDLKAQVLPLVTNDPIMDNVYVIQGNELDGLMVDKASLLEQLFVDSATWGLSKWEEFLGIQFDARKSETERRNAIKSKLLGTKVFTIQMVKDIASLFGYTVAFIQENVDPYVVKIKLTTTTDFVQVRSFIASIEDVKPAHLSFIYLYNLSTWGDLESSLIDYDTLKEYKWQDFLLSGEGDGARYHTDFMNLKQWAYDDVFLYKDHNFNFTEIDKKFHQTTGHTHNGVDSAKIPTTSIQYDATQTALDKIKAIDALVGSSTGKTDLAAAIGAPAVATDTYATFGTKITSGKQSIATALTNKGKASTSSETFDSYATKVRALAGTVIPAGTALPEEVMEGKTFVNSSGTQTGTAKVRTGVTWIPSHSGDFIIAGFHDGTCKIAGDPDLLPQNILKGVNICGVVGTTGNPDYVEGDYVPYDKVQINKDGNGNIVSYTILA